MFKYILVILLCWLASPALAQKTKGEMITEINANWPNNSTGQITPEKLRSTVIDLVNSYYDLNGSNSLTCAVNQWVTGMPTLSSLSCAPLIFTGDLTGTYPSPVLATVNSNVGTFGSSTNCVTITVNAKGLITAASQTACAGGGSGTPGGSSGQVQYNNAGAFGGFTTSGDATINTGTGALTLATVNTNIGTWGSATLCAAFNVNAKGLITAAANSACTPALANITGFGTGIAAALAINTGTAGAPVLFDGAGGTPSSLTGTNITGTAAGLTAGAANAVAVGNITGAGTGCITWLTTPSSANLRGCLTDESGTGVAYFQGGALGTPSSGTLTSATGLPISTGLTGAGTGVLTALGVNVGSAGAVVVNGGVLGTPSSGVATNITALNASQLTTGSVPTARLDLPRLYAYLSADQTGVVDSTETTVNIDTEIIDSLNSFNTTTHVYTPSVSGYYLVTVKVRCNTATTLTACVADITRTGTVYARASAVPGAGTTVDAQVTAIVQMNGSSDTITPQGQIIGTGAEVFKGGGSPIVTSITATWVGP